MQEKIKQANTKLERVKIVRRGSKLTLRATLPLKPGHGSKNKQYTLSPGFNANEEGLKLTVVEAQRIEADLIYGRFSWDIQKDQLIIEKAIRQSLALRGLAQRGATRSRNLKRIIGNVKRRLLTELIIINMIIPIIFCFCLKIRS